MKKTCQTKSPPLYVTKPDLPDIDQFKKELDQIWERAWLTNNGPVEQRFEEALKNFLHIENVCLFNNGTLALEAALSCLDLKGEVITTPFSYVATALAIERAGLKPHFIDIDPETKCICPDQIESAITYKTAAIVGVHVYSTPCAIKEIDRIAKKHNLKVIYDAAHCFAAQYKGKSLFEYGDISITSFHATKSFHSIEGGAVFTHDKKLLKRVQKYKQFGFNNEGMTDQTGTNAKMNEIQAAMGILNLKSINHHIKDRNTAFDIYNKSLKNIPGIQLPEVIKHLKGNYTYYPIYVQEPYPLNRDQLFEKFKDDNIHTRRYFHPLITDMPYFAQHKNEFPNATKASNEVICLPLFSSMTPEEQQRVINIIKNNAGIL